MNFKTMMQSVPLKANDLFARLAETSDGAVKTREKLFTELKTELELHAALEEQHLFPILRKNAETKDLVIEAVRDNKELRAKLDELEAMPKNDQTFSEKLADLQKAFRQHARDEKKEFLPAVQKALSEEQVQNVTEKMEAGFAEAEQAKQDEMEQRRAKLRQERDEAEFLARQADLRAQRVEAAAHEEEAPEQRGHAGTQRMVEAAVRPAAAVIKAAEEMTRLPAALAGAEMPQRARTQAAALTHMFMWPWIGAMQTMPQSGMSSTARGPSGMEEIIPLGEEVLEVGKRTENRGTVRIRRFVTNTPVEQQVTLQSEKVVVERRRPVSDQVTGEILTEVTVEVVETEEVATVSKRVRLREEIVVRTERAQRVETVKATVRRDDVEIEHAGRKQEKRQLRPMTHGH